MKGMVMIGATSAIAHAVARKLANPEAGFFLVGRNGARLSAIAADLETRGVAAVHTMVVDLCDVSRHSEIVEEASSKLGEIDLVLISHGTLPDQMQLEKSYPATFQCLQENALSVISLATLFGNYFGDLGRGSLIAISSVAGERGRRSNYVYGTAKAAVTTFMQGLRNRLHSEGVHVLTVKPGFVDTPMTAGFRKGLLWTTPDAVAKDIIRGIRKRRDVVYTPFFWRYIMLLIRIIPEAIFKRMKL